MAHVTATADNRTSTFEVADGTKLVFALEENGVAILHKCGEYAKCATCQVQFDVGEPDRRPKQKQKQNLQKIVTWVVPDCFTRSKPVGDMTLTAVMTVSSSDFDEPGHTSAAEITPWHHSVASLPDIAP